ncbi:MAG: efflux RND transporter periplasmic adaptor subunit [Myxococcales bacterium]
MNPHIQAAALAAIGVSICGLLSGCSHSSVAAERKPIPVKVRSVEQASGSTLARYSGTLEPAAEVDLAFRVGGYVEMLAEVTDEDGKSRHIDQGDFVKKGSVLARIRSADYAQKVASARAQVSQARSESKLADAELERSRRLFETKAITKAELDAKVARADSAKANVDGALAVAGEAGVAMDDTVLRAPMDGVVLWRRVEVGTLVSPGQQAISVADTRTMKASFAVPQALVEKLSLGSPVQVHLEAEGTLAARDKVIDARVTRIAPAADTKGRVFSVEAALPNDKGTLRPGSVISVRIPEATLGSATLSVPLSAVVRAPSDPRGYSVFVLDGEGTRARARLHNVELGEVLGNFVTVSNGLSSGQRVVTVGATLIRDGSDTVVIP